jgi:PAS domain S-box-containing protein
MDTSAASTAELFETLFESAPDAILLVGPAGTIARVNARTERVFGCERGELIGRPIEALVPERFHQRHEHHREGYVASPRTRPMGEGLALFGCRPDGSEFPVEIALAPVVTGGGRFVLCIVRDVTRRHEVEAALQKAHADLERRVAERTAELSEANRRLVEEQAKLIQAEKLSSIGLLASGVAHEINNPLSGVMGLIKALEEEQLPEPQRAEFFEAAREGLERMRMTVQSLLNFARRQTPARETLDVAETTLACIRLVSPAARRKSVHIALEVRAGEALVHADRSQFMQAVLNVLMNAIHAAPSGTTVRVTSRAAGKHVAIQIEDEGPGIPEAIRGRVTDPFFTTKPEGEGTGLGLAVTLGILRAHAGELAIADREGGGTRITLSFPAGATGDGDA